MKQTSEALSKAQDQAMARRQLLESGRVRLVPDPPKPPEEQRQPEQTPKKDSK